jgi:hypothetical protein
MSARKVLIIDAPIFVEVDGEVDENTVAEDFNSGFQDKISDFDGYAFYNPEILDASVREIHIATPEEIEAVGIEVKGDSQ